MFLLEKEKKQYAQYFRKHNKSHKHCTKGCLFFLKDEFLESFKGFYVYWLKCPN